MPTIEERALATAIEAAGRRMQDYRVMAEENLLRRSIEAHARALEAHDATLAEFEEFKREVSDSVEHYLDQWRNSTPSREVFACQFGSFILAKPVDQLVEVQNLLDEGLTLEEAIGSLSLKLVEVGDAD